VGVSPVEKFRGNWELTNANIDLISEQLQEYLRELNVDQKQILRLCLSVEDVLWQWQVRLVGKSSVRRYRRHAPGTSFH
jgi:hypothetical protein